MSETTYSDRYTGRCTARVEPRSSRFASQSNVLLFYAPEASAHESNEPTLPEGGGGAPASVPRPRARTGKKQLHALPDTLSDRDWQILNSLTAHPFLTTSQIQRLHFIDHTSLSSGSRVCRRVLSRLADIRAIEHLERHIGGVRAGSASFVWRLGPVGERLLQLRAAGVDRPRLRRKEPSLHRLNHCLAVAETHIRLLESGRERSPELVRVETEPTCWRPFATLGGGRAVLKPDLYAVTATADYEDSWFIEVDLGTESLPTLLHKCRQYEEYRRSGVEQRDYGVFPFVLWLLLDEKRKDALSAALDKAGDLDRSLYRLGAFDELIKTITNFGSLTK
jgi:hypothetical protein